MSKTANALLLLIGLVLILIAGGLLFFTQQEEQVAQNYSAQVVDEFCQKVVPPSPPDPVPKALEPTEPAEVTEPPAIELDGTLYIGMLSLPQLGLDLPIAKTLTDAQLKYTPAVFSGTLAEGNLVIGGHNYRSHFGSLIKLAFNDEIVLVDTAGITHTFTLTAHQQLEGSQLDALLAGDWDLTLFTCLYKDPSLRTVLRFTASS